jgi:hypothetical protein
VRIAEGKLKVHGGVTVGPYKWACKISRRGDLHRVYAYIEGQGGRWVYMPIELLSECHYTERLSAINIARIFLDSIENGTIYNPDMSEDWYDR